MACFLETLNIEQLMKICNDLFIVEIDMQRCGLNVDNVRKHRLECRDVLRKRLDQK